MFTIEERWKEHCHDCKKERCKNRPLYRAMKKYGTDAFEIEQIEECDTSILAEREIYWIDHFGTYHNGYNATKGGDGTPFIDYDIVVKTYQTVQNQKETAKILGISVDTVRKILRNEQIQIISSKDIQREKRGHAIEMLSMSGEYICTFSCCRDALRYLFNTDNTDRVAYASSHIKEVCQGKRKSAYKYKWRYPQED